MLIPDALAHHSEMKSPRSEAAKKNEPHLSQRPSARLLANRCRLLKAASRDDVTAIGGLDNEGLLGCFDFVSAAAQTIKTFLAI